MKSFRSFVPWVLAAALLSACGGSDPYVPGNGSPAGAPTTKGSFTAVVSFGDSLSDVGTYAPATSLAGNGTPPFFGGKFTTNETSNGQPDANPLGKVWVELVAASLGIVVTPAEVGFGASSVQCPAAANPAFASTCTAYGEGGSRVTDPNGIGHSSGALTVPVVTQIANHLARFGSFKSSDLVFVYAGSNDVFTQFGIFAATAAQVQADAAAGLVTPDQANVALFNAQQTAEAAMKTAALELVNDITGQILAKGGTYVAVMTLSDIADTPFGNSLPADGAAGADRAVAGLQPVAARRPDEPAGADHRHLRDLQGRLPESGQVRHRQQHGSGVRRRQDQRRHRRRGHGRLVAVLQRDTGRAVQRSARRRRRRHLAVRRQRPPDHRWPQDHRRRLHGAAEVVRLDLTHADRRIMKTSCSLALAAALAFAAGAAMAQQNVVKVGVTYYQTHSQTDGISGIGVPPGADVEVGNATTVIFVYERLLTPNVGVEFVLGVPPKITATGTGSVAFLGEVLSTKNVSPTLFVNYHFFEPTATLRPYVGAGINYTRFADVTSSLASDVSMGSSTGWAVQAGLHYAIDKDWGLFASIAALQVKSKVVATGATVLTTTVDFRPIVYSAGVSRQF